MIKHNMIKQVISAIKEKRAEAVPGGFADHPIHGEIPEFQEAAFWSDGVLYGFQLALEAIEEMAEDEAVDQ